MSSRRVTVPGRLAALGELRGAIDALAAEYACRSPAPTARQLYGWGLAVYEAATNVVRHGYGGDSDAPLTLEIAPGDGEVTFRLIDTGRPNPGWAAPAEPHASGEGGYGLSIIRALVDELSYEHNPAGANVLTLHVHFGSEEAR